MFSKGICFTTRRGLTRAVTASALISGAAGGLVAISPALPASAVGTTVAGVSVTSSSASNTSTFGDAVTFAVTVTGTSPTPTGTVSFSYTNSLPIHANHVFKPVCSESATANNVVTLAPAVAAGTATASCTPTVAIDAGTDSVTAAYSGDATYAAGNGNVAQTVNTRATSGSLAGPGTNTQYGQPASFTDTITVPSDGKTQAATVTPPAGTVTVSQGATKLCGGSVQPAGAATAAGAAA